MPVLANDVGPILYHLVSSRGRNSPVRSFATVGDRTKFRAILCLLSARFPTRAFHCETLIRPLRVKTGHYRSFGIPKCNRDQRKTARTMRAKSPRKGLLWETGGLPVPTAMRSRNPRAQCVSER